MPYTGWGSSKDGQIFHALSGKTSRIHWIHLKLDNQDTAVSSVVASEHNPSPYSTCGLYSSRWRILTTHLDIQSQTLSIHDSLAYQRQDTPFPIFFCCIGKSNSLMAHHPGTDIPSAKGRLCSPHRFSIALYAHQRTYMDISNLARSIESISRPISHCLGNRSARCGIMLKWLRNWDLSLWRSKASSCHSIPRFWGEKGPSPISFSVLT